MTERDIAITIIASTLSGILSVIISTIYYRRHEKYRVKVDTLKKFVSNRFDLKGDEFTRALNEIFIVFNKSKIIMDDLSQFHCKIVNHQPAEDALVRLFKSMCDDVNIEYDKINDSFFLKPFNTRSSSAA